MAFAVISCQPAETTAKLVSALARATGLPVSKAAQKTTIEPNHVYIISPEKLTRITGPVLVSEPQRQERGTTKPIDYFLQSLAVDRKTSAIAVVICGVEACGALGLQAIREAGGLAVAVNESIGTTGLAIEGIRDELTRANRRLDAIAAERDDANHELLAANEQIQASLAQLQTFSKELEISREELQVTNEQLVALNKELQNRNRQLARSNDDFANLLSSTSIPMLMVDNDLKIRRATPAAEHLFNIQAAAKGRPLGDVRLHLGESVDALVRRVIETSTEEKMELPDPEGRWNLVRAFPYRKRDNRVEGAVLTMLDIDELHRAQTTADAARKFAESIVESVQIPLLVLKSDLRVRVVNQAFLAAYGRRLSEIEDRSLDEIGKAQWGLPELKRALARLSNKETSSEALECVQNIPAVGKRTVLINARRIRLQDEQQFLIAVQDITAHKDAERIMAKEQDRLKRNAERVATALLETEDALRLSRKELRALTGSLMHAQDEERRRLSRELHDDVSQNIAMLQFDIEALSKRFHLPSKVKSGS